MPPDPSRRCRCCLPIPHSRCCCQESMVPKNSFPSVALWPPFLAALPLLLWIYSVLLQDSGAALITRNGSCGACTSHFRRSRTLGAAIRLPDFFSKQDLPSPTLLSLHKVMAVPQMSAMVLGAGTFPSLPGSHARKWHTTRTKQFYHW